MKRKERKVNGSSTNYIPRHDVTWRDITKHDIPSIISLSVINCEGTGHVTVNFVLLLFFNVLHSYFLTLV